MSIQSEREQQHQRDAEIVRMMSLRVEPGSFLIGQTIGGFTDVASGLHIPGPKAGELDANRNVLSLFWGDTVPIQVPTHRVIRPVDAKTGKLADPIEIAFDDDTDAMDFTGGLDAALRSGTIRAVEREEMERRWPEAWSARFDRRVHQSNDAQRASAVADLFAAAAKVAPR